MAFRVKTTEISEVQIQQLYARFTFRKVLLLLLLLGALFVLVVVAASLGAASIGIKGTFSAILGRIFPLHLEYTRLAQVIIWQMRLPRILMALLAGAALALSGTVMQGILRNPLASPFTLGIASAAGFGAAIAITLGVGFIGWGKTLIATNAFLFALCASFIVYALARLRGVTSETMILAGIATMYLFSALTSVLQYIGRKEDVHAVVFWLMGNLTGASSGKTLLIFIILVGTLPLLIRYAWDLNAIAAGDEVAASLGVNVKQVRITGMILATLVTSSVICFTGTIGFVGLVSPHMARMLIGGNHRFLLPASCLLGALLLLGADTAARTVIAPTEIPVGIMTSFVGIPFFLYLLMKKRKEYWK